MSWQLRSFWMLTCALLAKPYLRAHEDPEVLRSIRAPAQMDSSCGRRPSCAVLAARRAAPGSPPGRSRRARRSSTSTAAPTLRDRRAHFAGPLARLSDRCGIEVCAPRYRLAPEHPFPAAFTTRSGAWRDLRSAGLRPGGHRDRGGQRGRRARARAARRALPARHAARGCLRLLALDRSRAVPATAPRAMPQADAAAGRAARGRGGALSAGVTAGPTRAPRRSTADFPARRRCCSRSARPRSSATTARRMAERLRSFGAAVTRASVGRTCRMSGRSSTAGCPRRARACRARRTSFRPRLIRTQAGSSALRRCAGGGSPSLPSRSAMVRATRNHPVIAARREAEPLRGSDQQRGLAVGSGARSPRASRPAHRHSVRMPGDACEARAPARPRAATRAATSAERSPGRPAGRDR